MSGPSGTVGMLTWMPTTRSRCISPTVVVTAEPQSPPCAPKRSYPSRLISVAHACAIHGMPRPRVDGLSLNPYPGSDGQTTWKASAASPPCATGSVNGPITSRNSTVGPGPAVRDDQRHRVGFGRAGVHEVDVEIVDPGR